jgi:SNF2 family DNA or RNA helicase
MKNNSSLNFKTITSLKAKHKIAMTGTPIENNLSELWSLMHFIMPNLLGNYSKFVKYYETPITKFEDEDRLDKLKNIVQPFILRRMKTDVLTELPSKLEEFKYANLDGEHYLAYQEALVDIRNTIKNNGQQIENKIIILSMLTRLRQLACDARLLTPTIKKISPKLELALEIIEKSIENERKILLFSQFTSMLDLIEIELNKKGIKFYTLKGSTPKEKRDQMSENFNKDETMVFLISLKAGGTGLNLTGASTVIHFDPWWNMSAQNQATDRVHRIGQKDNVLVYKLISESTIEEKIVKLQEEKSVLAKNMLDDNSNNIGKLSKDELLDLFNV